MATISKIGFCKCRLLENGNSENIDQNAISDIQNNYGVQFKFDYSWTGTTCNITNIEWKTVQMNPAEHSVQDVTLSCDKYTVINKLQISFNGVNLTLHNSSVQNGTVSSVSREGINTQYMLASFKYSYTDNNIEYYIEIPNIKIPKTSKYEHNVIFTENGLNELLTNIKNYPVIDINATPEAQWENGQPSITVTHGNSANTKKVNVGSNIKFIDPSTELEINSAASNTWNDGTFRVKINNTTYQVPIKGLSGTGSDGIPYVKKSGDTMTGNLTIGTNDDANQRAVFVRSTTGTLALVSDSNNSKMYCYAKVNGSDATTATWPFEVKYNSSITQNHKAEVNFYGTTFNGTTFNGGTFNGTTVTASGNITASGDLFGKHLRLNAGSSGIGSITMHGELTKGTTPPSKSLYGGAIYFGTDDNNSTSLEKSTARICNYVNTNNTTVFNLIALKNESNNSSDYTNLELLYYPNTASQTFSNTGSFTNYNKRVTVGDDTVFSATKVFGAVFNDYAECRTTIDLTPGHVVIDNDDGSLSCSSSRLQPGGQVISDTFGFSIGETENAKTPLAVTGRVLVYTYQPRENYHAGMAVCSAPNGTVDIMTREEIRDYPDCIIGIVSEIPQYETWGTDNVKVDGRIWIKVK